MDIKIQVGYLVIHSRWIEVGKKFGGRGIDRQSQLGKKSGNLKILIFWVLHQNFNLKWWAAPMFCKTSSNSASDLSYAKGWGDLKQKYFSCSHFRSRGHFFWNCSSIATVLFKFYISRCGLICWGNKLINGGVGSNKNDDFEHVYMW